MWTRRPQPCSVSCLSHHRKQRPVLACISYSPTSSTFLCGSHLPPLARLPQSLPWKCWRGDSWAAQRSSCWVCSRFLRMMSCLLPFDPEKPRSEHRRSLQVTAIWSGGSPGVEHSGLPSMSLRTPDFPLPSLHPKQKQNTINYASNFYTGETATKGLPPVPGQPGLQKEISREDKIKQNLKQQTHQSCGK